MLNVTGTTLVWIPIIYNAQVRFLLRSYIIERPTGGCRKALKYSVTPDWHMNSTQVLSFSLKSGVMLGRPSTVNQEQMFKHEVLTLISQFSSLIELYVKYLTFCFIANLKRCQNTDTLPMPLIIGRSKRFCLFPPSVCYEVLAEICWHH